ncbi:MAG: hypothetical protein ACKVQU_22220 [Burkholderiales bacterium]
MSESRPTKDALAALWKSGVPLDSAWIEFAEFLDAFAVRALRTDPCNDADVLGLDHPRYRQLSKGWLPISSESRAKKLEIATRNERTNLLQEIYAGRLWAIGYRSLPDGTDELTRVPRQPFFVDEAGERNKRPDIHWGKAQLTVGNASYFDIRVVRPPPSGDDGAEALQSQESSAPKQGRRNTRDQIRRAVEELWDTDTAFRAIPHRRDQAREVRARLRGKDARHLDSMQGYRTTTIQRIIGEVANKRERSE